MKDLSHRFITTEYGRLDEVMAKQLNISRAQVQKYISQGVLLEGNSVTKNGTKVKPGQEVVYFDLVFSDSPPPDTSVIPYQTIYEDESILVITKPRGLVVHPSPGHVNDTLVNYLLAHYKEIRNLQEEMDPIRPGIVHRIDKDTSGLLVIGKSASVCKELSSMIARHEVSREYLCLAHGVPRNKKFLIEAPIARDRYDRKRMSIDVVNGKEAYTHVEVISTSNDISLLHCRLATGRTHQIRLHLSYFQYPIIGDPMYGLKKDLAKYTQGQLLHAYKISFIHPITKKNLTFYSPIDGYFKEAIRDFYSN